MSTLDWSNSAANQIGNFFGELMSNYQYEFGNFQGIFKALRASFMPILKAGIGQQGFTPAENAAIRTSATEGVAQNYQQANKAVNEKLASLGGGNEFLPSGATAQINADLAQQAAQEQSSEQSAITQENYALGRQNYLTAAGILGGLPSVLGAANPTAGIASETGQGYFGDVNRIAGEQPANPWMGAVGGILGTAANALLPGVGSALGGLFGGSQNGSESLSMGQLNTGNF